MADRGSSPDLDAVVVGAGFAGLYSLYKLRTLGFTAQAFEAGDDVGGTWYWNRYPGARCDIESMFYSYQFDDALQQEWEWSERYSAQPEILAYARHVADRFDLRRDITFGTLVTAARWVDETALWTVETDKGEQVNARFLILGTGNLSSTNLPDIVGIGDFAGPIYHTGRWPQEGVDFSGRKVAVIGTGSSAIQAIPEIAKQADRVTVFQRTANYTIPAWNGPLDPKVAADIKANYDTLRAKARHYFTCNIVEPEGDSALAVDEAARRADYEKKWGEGGLNFIGTYRDLLFDADANKTAADFVKAKIREIVKDPETAEDLCPTNIIGCKRLCADTDYYATYNRDNVRLVNLKKTPIERITAEGVVAGGDLHEADALVCATGFDAMTGTILKIDIQGPRRPAHPGCVGRRAAHLPGARHRGLPQHVHDHRAGQSQCARQHDPGDRAACGFHCRLPDPHARDRRPGGGADARCPGRLGRACQRDRRQLAALHLRQLVCGRQRGRASRGSSCPTSAASRSIARPARRSSPTAIAASRSGNAMNQVERTSTLTCPECRHAEAAEMPTDAWPVFLRLPRLRRAPEAEAGRLLRLLQLWRRPLPAGPGRPLLSRAPCCVDGAVW